MRIFVTGGAGFIGSHFVRTLLNDGYPAYAGAQVTVYDKLTYAGNLENLADVSEDPRYAFVQGDICDPALLDEHLPGHDLVINFAAESHVDRSITGAADFVVTNVLGAQTVFDACLRAGTPRVVHIGTDEVYGSIDVGSWTEDQPLLPNSPYSAAKAGAELLARAYGVARAAAVVRVRPPALGLVASNARLNVAATASGGVAAAVGFAISSSIGTSWVLRLAAVVFLAAAVASLRLPSHVDDARRTDSEPPSPFAMRSAPSVVRRLLVATVSLRAISGLLTLGLAILLKAHRTPTVLVGFVLGAAVVGGLLGTALASRLPAERTARVTAVAVLAPILGCVVAAVVGSAVLTALAVGLTGFGAALGKYALDAALQTHVPPSQTGSAFARSETALQLGWALGGGLGLALSLVDRTGLGAAGARAVLFAVAAGFPVAGLVVGRRWVRRAGV